MKHFDVIVIGGGHAGVEAAAAASRLGVKVALVTFKKQDLGVMSCNPAIGGVGKGHLVREIDALDGVMGIAGDKAAIQYRLLNRRKGSAVRGPRSQADRELYQKAIINFIDSDENINVIEGEAEDIIITNDIIKGVIVSGVEIYAKSVVITTGTFLGGIVHIGKQRKENGRFGSNSSTKLAEKIRGSGLQTSRLKTGTPARLDGRTIDWSQVELQKADDEPEYFSFLKPKEMQSQICCGITYTNSDVHNLIQDNLDKSSIFNGNIKSKGPRYCPSIEDKIVRFFDREAHQIFLEPEGLNSNLIYPNGLSSSLPVDVQINFLRKIKGLEKVSIVRPGYAVEYDYVTPTQLHITLECKAIENLFLAGQINGTTGYEEAAAQGLIAGINAAKKATDGSSFILGRNEAYIGVLIDDLTTKGISEPYRMFTSRAEYRLHLRADNADLRLTEKGYNSGLVSSNRFQQYNDYQNELSKVRNYMVDNSISNKALLGDGLKINRDGRRRSLYSLVADDLLSFSDLQTQYINLSDISEEVKKQIIIEAQYSNYLDKQQKDIDDYIQSDGMKIPQNIDYSQVDGLSNEMQQKFSDNKPITIGEAKVIESVTPASILILRAYINKQRQSAQSSMLYENS